MIRRSEETVAIETARAGRLVSSASVLIASKPRKEKQATAVPANSGLQWKLAALKIGFIEKTVPAPVPPLRVCTAAPMNHAITTSETSSSTAEILASQRTSRRLKNVTTITAATTHHQ